jgi:LysM repeat protein
MPLRFRSFLLHLCLFLAPVLAYAGKMPVNDTIIPTQPSITDERALKLLTTDPVFMENWINDVTLVYDNVRAVDLPDVTTIPIRFPGEKFTATWYGKFSSAYKWRWGRQHHGVDLGLKTGDTIYAAWNGVVRYAQWNKSGYGNCVVIRHKNGLETLYGHMSKLLVSPNEYVTSGEVIGLGGSTGRSTGPHLHFEIRYKDFSINPELVIDYSTRQVKLDTLQFVRSQIKGTTYNPPAEIASGKIVLQNSLANNSELRSDTAKAVISQPVETLPQNTIRAEEKVEKPIEEKKSVVSAPKRNPEPPAKPTAGKKTNPAPAKKEVGKKKQAPAKKATTYTIKSGDTYTSIAKKMGVSIQSLKKLNPKQKETLLMPGKTIRIR